MAKNNLEKGGKPKASTEKFKPTMLRDTKVVLTYSKEEGKPAKGHKNIRAFYSPKRNRHNQPQMPYKEYKKFQNLMLPPNVTMHNCTCKIKNNV